MLFSSLCVEYTDISSISRTFKETKDFKYDPSNDGREVKVLSVVRYVVVLVSKETMTFEGFTPVVGGGVMRMGSKATWGGLGGRFAGSEGTGGK